ncbi:hypothetical protein HK405_009658, partial [Cladochytrium tenue]
MTMRTQLGNICRFAKWMSAKGFLDPAKMDRIVAKFVPEGEHTVKFLDSAIKGITYEFGLDDEELQLARHFSTTNSATFTLILKKCMDHGGKDSNKHVKNFRVISNNSRQLKGHLFEELQSWNEFVRNQPRSEKELRDLKVLLGNAFEVHEITEYAPGFLSFLETYDVYPSLQGVVEKFTNGEVGNEFNDPSVAVKQFRYLGAVGFRSYHLSLFSALAEAEEFVRFILDRKDFDGRVKWLTGVVQGYDAREALLHSVVAVEKIIHVVLDPERGKNDDFK